ncbi:hypothetical protein FRC03_009804 [Tulasnella sp. 419]|nr:hypothetical protein FRC02_002836 [Tulasnella sp. 418]KAG8967551.1 hypothetical protein FRC03_009804 [Tulasnella sp. 419]
MEIFTSTPELVGALMEHTSGSQATLANCARVNHLFANEAIRVLWRELYNLSPLLGCLPPEAAKVLKGPYLKRVKHVLSPSEWTNALQYASYVRKIFFVNERTDLVSVISQADYDSIILEAFHKTFPNRPLFPKLIHAVDVPADLALLPPSLQVAGITIANNHDIPSVVNSIQRMTLLRSLRLNSSLTFSDEDMAGLLENKERLTELTLQISVTWTQLHSVRQCANLRSLSIWIQDMAIPDGRNKSLQIHLPHLETLHVAGDAQIMIPFIQCAQLNPKAAISFHVTSRSANVSFSSLIHDICNSASPTLKSLTITNGYRPRPHLFNIDHQSIGFDVLRPLFRLKQLNQLILNLDAPIRLSGMEILDLVPGLPEIREINLLPRREWGLRRQTALLSPSHLLYFAQAAPQLQYLGIEVKGSWRDLQNEVMSFRSKSCLETLHVGRSELTVADGEEDMDEDVFVTLKQIFPGLRQVDFTDVRTSGVFGGDRMEADVMIWRRIAKLVAKYRK